MRSLEINKRQIFFAVQTGTEKVGVYDEARPVYSEPRALSIRVEYVSSSVSVAGYGKRITCDVKLITSKTSYPIDENTVFWIDAPTNGPYDYIMAEKPKKSINGTVYYLKEVGVSYA